MNDQKITKNRRSVSFTLADGSNVEGYVFLSLYEACHEGPQRLGNLLNSVDTFIPVDTPNGLLHLNIVNIIAAYTPLSEEKSDLMTLGARHRVQINTSLGSVIEGEIFVNLPNERNRVSDYLNQGERFFRVFLQETIVYIGSRYIVTVRD
jgi:hypothetical protein